jgi:hypothetical protein
MVSVYLMRHLDNPGIAMKNWFLETWLYFVIFAAVLGALWGLMSQYLLRLALKKKMIDGESYILWGVFSGVRLHIFHRAT